MGKTKYHKKKKRKENEHEKEPSAGKVKEMERRNPKIMMERAMSPLQMMVHAI